MLVFDVPPKTGPEVPVPKPDEAVPNTAPVEGWPNVLAVVVVVGVPNAFDVPVGVPNAELVLLPNKFVEFVAGVVEPNILDAAVVVTVAEPLKANGFDAVFVPNVNVLVVFAGVLPNVLLL